MTKKPKIDKGTGEGLSKEDCLELGEKALSLFTSDEVNDYVQSIFEKANTYSSLKGKAAIKQAIKDIDNEKMKVLFHECVVKANNTVKFNLRNKKIEEGKATIRELLTSRYRSKSDNVSQSQSSAKGKLADITFKNMTKEQQKFLWNKDNEQDLLAALDGKQSSPMAKEIAEQVKEFRDARNSMMVESNALSIEGINSYKYLDHMHDQSKIMGGGLVQRAKNLLNGIKNNSNPKQVWKEYIKESLDPKNPINGAKLFDKDGNFDEERLDSIIDKAYENITTNKSEIFANSVVLNDRSAIERKQHMTFNFKDWKSWGEYNSKYGSGSLSAALMKDLHASGNKIGMANFFGDNPYNTYLDLKSTQYKKGIDVKSPTTWFKNTDLIFKQVMGIDQTAVSPGLAAFRSNISALTSAVRLIGLPLQSLADMAHGVEYIGRFGYPRMKASAEFMMNIFNNPVFSSEERQEIAKKFKLMTDSHLGYICKFSDSQNVGDLMNRLINLVFSINKMHAFDNGNKISILHVMAKTIGDNSSNSWDGLHEPLKKQLELHDISESEWELLRGKTEKGLFTTDNVDNLTNEELRDHYDKSDKTVPLSLMKNELYRKVYSLFDVASQNMVLSPDAFAKAFLYQGTAPGTVMGDLLRAFGQFKGFPFAYFDRVWMQGLHNADGMFPKLAFATRLLAGTMPLAYLSTVLSYSAQGKSVPDPERMTPVARRNFYISLALPGAGIFMSILDPRRQDENLLFSTLRSPSFNLVMHAMLSPIALMNGDTKKAKKELRKASEYVLPISTIPWISPLIKEALGDQPYLQNGQQQYYGA